MKHMKPGFRIEVDSMGQMEVPAEALYGRKLHGRSKNFPISNLRFPQRFI